MADPTRYPSPSMMNMAEAGRSELQFREYVGALLEKVATDRFPSTDHARAAHRPEWASGTCLGTLRLTEAMT